jgi:hypothetical protein
MKIWQVNKKLRFSSTINNTSVKAIKNPTIGRYPEVEQNVQIVGTEN